MKITGLNIDLQNTQIKFLEGEESTHNQETRIHLSMRVDSGGIVPAGECPECGALAYRLVLK